MNHVHLVIRASVALFALAAWARADHPADAAADSAIVSAVERGVALVEKGARNYPTHRRCFACHHQTLPLLAMREARAAHAKTDETLPATLVEFAGKSFRRQIDDLTAGENIGGRGLTVGYGLWTMRLAEAKPDDLTEAMVTYLIKTQEPDGHWALHAIRPPAEESLVLCTVLAAAGVKHFAAEAQRDQAAAAIEKARAWLASARLDSQEDRIARLWGIGLLGGNDEERTAARRAVLAVQRADGGWAQAADMESDAYASGSTLFVLLETGLPPADPSIRRGVDYLVKTQLEDGSWHVTTRAKPVQVFFDNGDPHGKDQFISIAAAGWSVAALARTIQRPGAGN